MTVLFSRFDGWPMHLALVATVAVEIVLLSLGVAGWPALVVAILVLMLTVLSLLSAQRTRRFLLDIARVSSAVRAGDFEVRLILPEAAPLVHRTALEFNGVIDVCDAFVREAALAMAASSQGRFYRKIRPEGMLGAFRKSVDGINAAIDAMEERQAMIMQSIEAVRGLAQRASAGDLQQRIDAAAFSGDYATFVQTMNQLLDNVAAPIREAGTALSALARADLRARMGRYDGEFGKLASDINSVAESMSDMVSRMRGTAGSLQAATGEILAGANDLSERTTRQAATIEQTSAAMESLAATVASNSKEAEFASIKATEAAKGAEAGEAIMQQASSAIARISDSSGRISNIIAVIDNIAFQTNLLALNASVEAARAGDAGGGFAVVAAEVRRLAQSAASQSAEVKALIETSIREVSNGVELVQQATEALAELRRMVIESATATQSIAAASSQQATALAEINIAVRQMDEMTQHNAALVEETNAAIEQTESQAADLNSVVATFQMSDPVRPQRGATLHFLAAS